MKPKPLVIPKPSPTKTPRAKDEKQRNSSGSSVPLSSSQAHNTPPGPETKPKLLLFGLGVKRSDGEDGENRPAKRSQGLRRAGKGDLRRL
jgi:hypothetical protein